MSAALLARNKITEGYITLLMRTIHNKLLLKVINLFCLTVIIKPLCLLLLRIIVNWYLKHLQKVSKQCLKWLESEEKEKIRYTIGYKEHILKAYHVLEVLHNLPYTFLPKYVRKDIKRNAKDCHQILSYIAEVTHIDTCIEAWPYEHSPTERKGRLHMLKLIKCFPFEAKLTIALSWLFSACFMLLWIADIVGSTIADIKGLPLIVGSAVCALFPLIFYFIRVDLWLPNQNEMGQG